jgi:hypothetical protein
MITNSRSQFFTGTLPRFTYMIPLNDRNPTRLFPFVTILLITINIVVFIYEISLGSML